ncbi:MAG TPA: hypothetical protein VF103_05615, partial [Polyangiaceae bacterium]
MRFLGHSLPIILALGVFACEKNEENKQRSAEAAASVDRSPALDPALAKAVAQASATRPQRGGPVVAGGPPQSGVFAPGAADKEAPRGAPPKLTLGDHGSEPRLTLGPMQPKPGWKANGTIEVANQANPQQGALPVRVNLTLEAQKPKAVADAGADAAAGFVTVTAKVTSAEPGVAGIPAELVTHIAALKGARVEYQVAPDGSGSGYRTELPASGKELQDLVRSVSDALALATIPVPNVPVGQGGFWMVTAREGVFGLDLVTYRMIKVEKITADVVTLSVGTKRYAASSRFDFEGLPKGTPNTLLEFDAKSDGRFDLKVGKSFPSS